MEYELFNDYLEVFFLDIESESDKNFNLTSIATLPFENESEYQKYNLPKAFFEVYKNSNGFELKWHDESNANYSGGLHFLNVKECIASNGFLDENDFANNDMLKYFYAFDIVTAETECGFMITPEETYKTIYYRSGFETNSLELDFVGYVTMLYHSRAYQNWPRVILDIINQEESEITEEFKTCMTSKDADFTWEKYTAIFNELRLDKE